MSPMAVSLIAPMAVPLIVPMASLLIQPIPSLLICAIFGKRVMGVGKAQEERFLPLLALPLIMKVMWKEDKRAGKGYNEILEGII